MLVDQHAAAERVELERLQRRVLEGDGSVLEIRGNHLSSTTCLTQEWRSLACFLKVAKNAATHGDP